jgi:hypothetical protein
MADKLFTEVQHTTAISAIEEAVKKSFWIQTQQQISREIYFEDKEPKHKRLKEVVEAGTRAMCYFGSKDVIYDLSLQNRDLFDSMILVSTELIDDDSWLKTEANQWFHTYFLVKDKDGMWYAGSPANNGVNKDKQYATTIIHGRNLGEVLEIMSERDKAHFPAESFVVDV